MNRGMMAVYLFMLAMMVMMSTVSTSSNAEGAYRNVRSVNKRSCSAYGERCETANDCCGHEKDHCIGCYARIDLIIAQYGHKRCGCQSTSGMVIGHPELGICNGYDRRTRQCRRRYE